MGLSAPGSGNGAITVSSITTPDQGSLCFWVRPQSVSGTQRLLGAGDPAEARFADTELFQDWGYSGAPPVSVTGFSVGTLRHVVFTWDLTGTETGEAFLNGAAFDSGSGFNDGNTGILALFARYDGSDPFEGELYDVRFYNRILSPAEVQTIYNSRGGDSIVYGLLHRWTMDEGASGATLSGSGVVKDRAQGSNNMSSSSGAPSYIYAGGVIPRRR